VTALETTGLFSTDELIAMWAVQTPQWLFPDRQLGRLAPGYEASFLVLEREPQSPSEIPDLIVAGYKQGERIEYAEP
jgi:predicted amidohydrolase YtcJ